MFILSTAYFPNIYYFSKILPYNSVTIERKENYRKQSYRNRMEVAGANGKLVLILPVKHQQKSIDDVEIENAVDWQKQHWRSIVSAYKSSAYFSYYEEEIYALVFQTETSLYAFNFNILKTLLHIFQWKGTIEETQEYRIDYDKDMDLREEITCKKSTVITPNYYQVFQHKLGFIPNLSILDLLFNEGHRATKLITVL